MLKYAIILLDRTATSFCYADNPYKDNGLISLVLLKNAIVWCMKENLRIQFVYPDYELPKEYISIINSIDHADIKHIQNADVTVFNGWNELHFAEINASSIVIRLTRKKLFNSQKDFLRLFDYTGHISIVITDIENFSDFDFSAYQDFLSSISGTIEDNTLREEMPQISLLTDRLFLSTMNNCNAGDESITIGPNGNFYVCPSFFFDNENDCVGNLKDGLNIKNGHLYKLQFAPICKTCDAFHCRRCVWLNRNSTLEVNTPSHEQCVISHLERNASQDLLYNIRNHGDFLSGTEIKEIDYLDPFDKLTRR